MAKIVWQADFYRRPLKDRRGEYLWELLICDVTRNFEFSTFCRQSEASPTWLIEQFQQASQGQTLPDAIQVFRPQSLSLIEVAGKSLGVPVEATRKTPTLKELLQERAQEYLTLDNYTGEAYNSVGLELPPPAPLPENLWGDRWRFAALSATDLQGIAELPIPLLEMPDSLLPMNLGLASTALVPGVIIEGGRQSMRLAKWLAEGKPVALNYIPGAPDGLVLEAGLVDRWIVATFEDNDVKAAAKTYEQRKQASQGLHFLLVQPDDSGMTYTGFWLLNLNA